MNCSKCGASNQDRAAACCKCGVSLSQAIWNPNAIALSSLLFSPVFGAFLHAINWHDLGETEKANSSMTWFYVSLVYWAMVSAMPTLATGAAMALLYFFIWYFASSRSQAKFVKANVGADYPRKSWGKPLLCGVVGLIAYVIALFVLEYVMRPE